MENLSSKEIGRRLQEVRKHIGLKQSDVAEKIDVEHDNIETGERRTSDQALSRKCWSSIRTIYH